MYFEIINNQNAKFEMYSKISVDTKKFFSAQLSKCLYEEDTEMCACVMHLYLQVTFLNKIHYH